MSAHYPLPAAAAASDQPEQESFVALRLWLAGTPWRLSGGWLVLAGLLAAAGPRVGQTPLLSTLLALALAEVLWGALWWQLATAHAWPLHAARRRPALPYVQRASPAGRLLGWPEPGPAAAIMRAGLPLTGLAALLALTLGQLALALTGVVLLAALLAMAARLAGVTGLVAWLHALVLAALPFGLGVSLHGLWPPAPQGAYLLGLGLGYMLLARALAGSANRSPVSRALHLLTAVAGYGALVVVLLVAGRMLAASGVGLLAVAPLLLLARSEPTTRAVQPWLLAAVLLSAAAVGFGIG